MRKTLAKKIQNKINSKENDKKPDENSEFLKNLKIPTPQLSIKQIKNTVDEIMDDKKKSIKTKKELENMSKEAIIIHCLNLNKKVEEIESYLEKYAQYRRGFNVEAFENNINYKEDIIKELNEKIVKLTKNVDEQVQAKINYMNVIKSQNHIIDKLKKEREKFMNNFYNKTKNYNGALGINFIMNEHSAYSNLINSVNKNQHINNFNNEVKRMRKSNSCNDINLSDYRDHKINKINYNQYNQYFCPPKIPNLDKTNIDKNNATKKK